MLELDFDNIRLETVSSIEREIVVHPVGHAERDYDHRAGIVLTWRDGMVGLATTRFFNDSGCYVTAHLGTFPDRLFPSDKEEAIRTVKDALGEFAARLVATVQIQTPCPACNGSGSDLYEGVGSCESCQGYGVVRP